MRVAAVQASPIWMDAPATATKTVALITQAANREADLIAFGESWLPGYPWPAFLHPPTASLKHYLDQYRSSAVSLDGPEINMIRQAATDHGIHVVLGVAERVDDQTYLAHLQIDASGSIASHRHRSALTVLELQTVHNAPDSNPVATPVGDGRVGVLGSAENLTRDLQQDLIRSGEQVHVAIWPGFCLSENSVPRSTAIPNARHYAIDNQCYVVVAMQIATQAICDQATGSSARARAVMEPGGGGAVVFDPMGDRLTDPIPDTEDGLAIADLDLALLPDRPRSPRARERGDKDEFVNPPRW